MSSDTRVFFQQNSNVNVQKFLESNMHRYQLHHGSTPLWAMPLFLTGMAANIASPVIRDLNHIDRVFYSATEHMKLLISTHTVSGDGALNHVIIWLFRQFSPHASIQLSPATITRVRNMLKGEYRLDVIDKAVQNMKLVDIYRPDHETSYEFYNEYEQLERYANEGGTLGPLKARVDRLASRVSADARMIDFETFHDLTRSIGDNPIVPMPRLTEANFYGTVNEEGRVHGAEYFSYQAQYLKHNRNTLGIQHRQNNKIYFSIGGFTNYVNLFDVKMNVKYGFCSHIKSMTVSSRNENGGVFVSNRLPTTFYLDPTLNGEQNFLPPDVQTERANVPAMTIAPSHGLATIDQSTEYSTQTKFSYPELLFDLNKSNMEKSQILFHDYERLLKRYGLDGVFHHTLGKFAGTIEFQVHRLIVNYLDASLENTFKTFIGVVENRAICLNVILPGREPNARSPINVFDIAMFNSINPFLFQMNVDEFQVYNVDFSQRHSLMSRNVNGIRWTVENPCFLYTNIDKRFQIIVSHTANFLPRGMLRSDIPEREKLSVIVHKLNPKFVLLNDATITEFKTMHPYMVLNLCTLAESIHMPVTNNRKASALISAFLSMHMKLYFPDLREPSVLGLKNDKGGWQNMLHKVDYGTKENVVSVRVVFARMYSRILERSGLSREDLACRMSSMRRDEDDNRLHQIACSDSSTTIIV